MVCVSFVQGEICAKFVCLFFLWWSRLSKAIILSADDWVCIFVLFVVYMRHPAQGALGGWVMLGLIFKWFPLCGVLIIWYSPGLVLWLSRVSEPVLPLQRLMASFLNICLTGWWSPWKQELVLSQVTFSSPVVWHRCFQLYLERYAAVNKPEAGLKNICILSM